jgi:hypothetical protein
VFVPEYGYTVSEHDPDRPWLVTDQRHETIELEDDTSFTEWAAGRYPRDRYTVELDPWSLSPQREQHEGGSSTA